MTYCLPHRNHAKRSSGFTGTIKQTLLKAQRDQEQDQIINDLIAKMNSTSTHDSKKSNKYLQARINPQQLLKPVQIHIGQCMIYQNRRVSIDNQQRLNLDSSVGKINRVQSVDKLSFKMNDGKKNRLGKKLRNCLFVDPPKNLSKKSTEYSLNSEQQALKFQNQQFRELCEKQQQRMNKLQKEIDQENKVQLIRRQMYQQKIERLKKIAALQIFPSEGSDQIPDSIEESGQDCDCLSIYSR